MQGSFNEENLTKLGIFELREIARNVGVHLPTTLKKEELIFQILEIVDGKKEPFVAKNKKGRPPKNFSGYEQSFKVGDLNLFRKDSQTKMSSWERESFVLSNEMINYYPVLKVESEQVNLEFDKDYLKRGILFCEANGWGSLHVGGLNQIGDSQICLVPPKFLTDFKLKDGDELFCKVEFSGRFVTNILSINDQSPLDHISKKQEPLNAISSKELIDFDGDLKFTKFVCPIGKGQRVLIYGDKKSGKTRMLEKMATSFCEKGIKPIIITLNKRPEDKINFENEEIEYAFASFDMSLFCQIYLIKLALERAKRLCENGRAVAVLIDDLAYMLEAFKSFLTKDEKLEFVSVLALSEFKKVLAVGKNTSNGGSITFVGTLLKGKEENDNLFDVVDEFFNSHIFLDKELNMFCDENVLPSSFTENDFELLSEKDLKTLKEIKSKTYNKPACDIAKIYKEYF